MAVLLSGTTIGGHVAVHANNISTYALTSVPANVITTSGGQTIAGITYFSNGESLNLYGIRGRFANEYIHLYEKVGIGHPGGWGQGEANTPTQGLSIYGGINIAYARDNGATINTYTRINKNWAGGDYSAEQFTIRGTYPSIALRSTQHNNVWLIHNDDTVSFYYGGGVDSNDWSRRLYIQTNGDIWMSWAGANISTLLDAKQNASTAINTGNIGSQSVDYANRAAYLPTLYAGGQQGNPQVYFGQSVGLRVAMTGIPFYWADTLWINGYSGGDVLDMCALHFARNSEPRMWISTQRSTAESYGTTYEVITEWNIASQSVSYAVTSGTSSATTQTNFSELFIEDVAVATKEYVTSQGYLTSLPSHNHDDRYYTESESDGRFQPLENQRLSTGNGPTFTEVYNNGWFRTTGFQGLYNPTNNAHFYPNNASYGSWRIDGSRNGWHGLHFDSGATLMMNSNESGVHREGYGWQFRWDNGTMYCHKNSYGGGTAATVWDSSNAPRANFGNLMYYQGFELDANTMATNSTGFTYANNAPFYGPIARFSTGGNYDLWIGGAYTGGNAFYLRTRNGDAGTFNAWREIITSGNIASQSVSYADESGYSASTGTTDNIGGVQFRNTGSNAGTNADTIDSNGITYYNAGVSNFSGNATDGALYSQRYSTSWQHQIAGDYRSGQIALRGRNNGTWQAWRTVLDSGNFSSYALPIVGGGLTTGASSNIFIGRNSTAANYNAISLNGNSADSSNMGLTGGGVGDSTLYINSPGNVALRTGGFSNQFTFSGGTFSAQASVQAPIFYDSQDTGYYGDFASTSVMNAIRLGTSTNNGTISGGGDWGIRFANDNGWIQFGPANNSWTHIYSDKNFYFNTDLYVNGTRVVLNSGTWGINISGNAASASSVDWYNVSNKPADWLNQTNLIQGNEPNTSRPSGFYESYLGAGNPTGTWFNYINVRHSNPGNVHGYQLGMSYYDNNLWFRSYQGNGTYMTWSRALGTNTDPYPSNMDQYVRTSDSVTFGGVTSPTILVNNQSDNTKGYRIWNTSNTSVSAMFVNSANALVIAAGAVDQVQMNKKVYLNGVALGVNVAASATAGRIDASNDIVAYSSSDERLKYNIAPIENALDKVKSLTGVEFDWKPEYKHAHGYEGHDTGIIAQQVQAVMPSAVRTNDTGFLAVRYEKLIGLLIEANKELAARVEELEKKIG